MGGVEGFLGLRNGVRFLAVGIFGGPRVMLAWLPAREGRWRHLAGRSLNGANLTCEGGLTSSGARLGCRGRASPSSGVLEPGADGERFGS